ncbi:phosphonate transport system substrate-binding protein [Blastococcus aurantiacus]|uniref:Phosphonate transport system substrate-binding protein n=1 Tax=Blastococcus aurantiacus TaxID=1550231 RepID=A0A1G7J754_9ACTN|nr:phosphate/phosphite/phosphonate ABC transporter substrate-binding protein [Blastococcus aurantiacus]SDF20711.1 phosphonate transport system substrate-binding protein [Blastococcus aurantiacus]
MRPTLRRPAALAMGLALAATTAAGCSSSSADEPDESDSTITFATTPLSDDPTVENPVEAFTELLEEETGRTVEVIDVPDYLSVVEAIRTDHVDIGIMSGFPSALAVNTGEVDALVAWPGNGEPVSTCMVLADSPYRDVADFEGQKLAMADQASSSGYFMPVQMLDAAGLTKDEDYEIVFAGGHDGAMLALKNGDVAAACTSTMLPPLSIEWGIFAEGDFRTVGESDGMAVSMSVLGSQELDTETRELLEKAIPEVFSAKNAGRLGVLMQGMEGAAMIAPDNDIFSPIVDVARLAGADISDLK